MRHALALLILAAATAAAADTNLVQVWDLEHGLTNQLGGGYNQFERRPSGVAVAFVDGEGRGGGRCLRVSYDQKDGGYCGVWFHLFDESAAPDSRAFLNATEYPFLSFWMKGEAGGENPTIQMADEEWLAKDDSKPVGRVARFAGAPLTTEWQEVVIPIERAELNVEKLAGITLNFTTASVGTVYVDDIAFKNAADRPVPVVQPAPARKKEEPRSLVRAMWVWEIELVLTNQAAQDEMFAFASDHAANEIFLQLPYAFVDPDSETVRCEIRLPDELRAFLRRAAGAGIRVHALDGYPEFVLRPYHRRVLAMVGAVADFNAAGEPAERFAGIHLDNEPYQILGFDGPRRREILLQYIEGNDKAKALLREKGSDLAYGVDIPFWFDERGMDGVLRASVTYTGELRNAAAHIIDIVDNVGIMDYRTFAGGVDGIAYHALGELRYAAKAGKKVYIGVETFRYEPTTVAFVFGVTEAEWTVLAGDSEGMLYRSAIDGFKVRTLSDGERRHVGLVQPSGVDTQAFNNALVKLYQLCGATAGGRDADVTQLYATGPDRLRANPEYQGFEPFSISDSESRLEAVGFRTTEIMPDKVTFGGKTKQELERVLAEAAELLKDEPAFAGFAIHHYTTWKAMP